MWNFRGLLLIMIPTCVITNALSILLHIWMLDQNAIHIKSLELDSSLSCYCIDVIVKISACQMNEREAVSFTISIQCKTDCIQWMVLSQRKRFVFRRVSVIGNCALYSSVHRDWQTATWGCCYVHMISKNSYSLIYEKLSYWYSSSGQRE